LDKTILNPASLAKPSGFSHGIKTTGGSLVFLAGQTALDAGGKIVAPGDMAGQFRQALANLRAVMEDAGGTMTDITSLTIFVTDLDAYKSRLKEIGASYREFLGSYYPAMALVNVARLWDDNAMIEIQGVAVVEEANPVGKFPENRS